MWLLCPVYAWPVYRVAAGHFFYIVKSAMEIAGNGIFIWSRSVKFWPGRNIPDPR